MYVVPFAVATPSFMNTHVRTTQEARKTLQVIQDEIKEKLDRRAVIREEKAFLHQLLKISESITRLESLLLISSPDDPEPDSAGVGAIPLQARLKDDSDDRCAST